MVQKRSTGGKGQTEPEVGLANGQEEAAKFELSSKSGSGAGIRSIPASHQGGTFRGNGPCHRNGPFLDGVFQQAPETPDAILPTDFLSFFISAAPVSDAYFVDPQPPLRYFDGDLWFKTKAVLFEGDGLDNLPAEHFVAGFHVGQVDVGKAI